MTCKVLNVINKSEKRISTAGTSGRVVKNASGKRSGKRVVKQTTIQIDNGATNEVRLVQQVDLVRTNQKLMLKMGFNSAHQNPVQISIHSRHPAVSVKNNTIVCPSGATCALFENLRFSGSSGRGKKIDLEIELRDCVTQSESLFEFKQAIKVTRDGERKRIRKPKSDEDATSSSSSSSSSWSCSSSSAAPSPARVSSPDLSTNLDQNYADFCRGLDYYNWLLGNQLNQTILDEIRTGFYNYLVTSNNS
jgi:hypothetical protein